MRQTLLSAEQLSAVEQVVSTNTSRTIRDEQQTAQEIIVNPESRTSTSTGPVLPQKPFHRGFQLPWVLPCAVPDLLDTFFSAYGVTVLGGSLYTVIFSFVTVGTALLRYFVLKKNPTIVQWAALGVISCGLAASAGTQFAVEFDLHLRF